MTSGDRVQYSARGKMALTPRNPARKGVIVSRGVIPQGSFPPIVAVVWEGTKTRQPIAVDFVELCVPVAAGLPSGADDE
jgi:hypothetical protein